jgi:AcrR family transcriptional regulator
VQGEIETRFTFLKSRIYSRVMKPGAVVGAGVSEPRPSLAPATRVDRDFAQARARNTYQALIRAAERVFADRGYDDAQSPEIAKTAGVSVGTFYRYFADKRQAFNEMIREHQQRTYELVMSNLTADAFSATRTPSERRSTIERVIDIMFQNVGEHPRLNHVFLALSMRDPDVARIRMDFEERGRSAIAALIFEVAPPGRIVDAAAAAEVIQIAANEVAVATIGSRGAPKTAENAARLRRALADMFYRYVFGDD